MPLAARWLYRRRRQWLRRKAGREAAEAERSAWSRLERGSFAVVVDGFASRQAEAQVAGLVALLPSFRESWTAVDELVDRVRHVGAQPVAERISEKDAARLQAALEDRGAQARILENAPEG